MCSSPDSGFADEVATSLGHLQPATTFGGNAQGVRLAAAPSEPGKKRDGWENGEQDGTTGEGQTHSLKLRLSNLCERAETTVLAACDACETRRAL